MPLAEKGVRGKGRQPLSPPSAGETRSAISAPNIRPERNRPLIPAERSPPNSPFQLKSSPGLFPSNRSSALSGSGTSRRSAPTTSLLVHKSLRTKQA